jgi:hypothetical protein
MTPSPSSQEEARELKACPKCEGTNIVIDQMSPHGKRYTRYCDTCDWSTATFETPEEATAAWNRPTPDLGDGLAALIDWRPIETLPFGERVMLFFEHGEKGNGEIDFSWVYPTDESNPAGPWHYWSWGGPNSGSDFERAEKPVLWADPEPIVASAIIALRAALDKKD